MRKYQQNNNKSKHGTFIKSKIKEVAAQPSCCSRVKVQLRNSEEQQNTKQRKHRMRKIQSSRRD